MTTEDYSEAEYRLLEWLPMLPATAGLRASNVWIIEWLPEGELQTGRLLHEWIEVARPGWSMWIRCQSKDDVLKAIARAEGFARRTGQVPILHLEAHGDDEGLVGPSWSGVFQRLAWDELTEPLQSLNVATCCNLIVVIAACEGFAGIKALVRGPRAPAVALVGSITQLDGAALLAAMKELYRRVRDDSPRMGDIVESMSREAGGVEFECEAYAALCYEALQDDLLRRLRKAKGRILLGDVPGAISVLPHPEQLQRVWDEMFVMDLCPENRLRFGIDMTLVLDIFLGELGIGQAGPPSESCAVPAPVGTP